jgi:hypothetical protein
MRTKKGITHFGGNKMYGNSEMKWEGTAFLNSCI